MTYAELKKKLTETCLFSDAEVHYIVRTCGSYTMGNAVIACQIAGIELNGNDIDQMFEAVSS
jgi:hypothetical protein